MSLFARLMYRALVWKERQRARRGHRSSPDAQSGDPPAHLTTGERGETLAYWYLRQAGYIIVARNRRARSGRGELDVVGWDGPVLAFVEVKTRTSLQGGPPEAAVSRAKQKRIARAAKEYLRKLRRRSVNYRFDIASVIWDAQSGYQVRLIKDAFKG
ncbi:MAG: YraN family protein [Acidobacteria bacterium]|nr:YraN family protein [Acidobacteriota bacterium]